MTTDQTTDNSLRFLFEDADIRGEILHLESAFERLLAVHDYSASVASLLGQFAVAAVLISNNLKYRGKIILQARSTGPISLIMLECTSEGEIRGIARGDIGAIADDPMTLIAGGQLAITIERNAGQRYQGIVPMDSGNLGSALDHYFLQSEQLNTRFWLFSEGSRAAGMVLQQLPAQLQQSAESRLDQWQTVTALTETLTRDELFDLPSAQLLHRLYHEHSVRLFEPKSISFNCSCSRDRCLNALATLGPGEVESLLEEQGDIDMTCEMCGTEYLFTADDLSALAESRVLH